MFNSTSGGIDIFSTISLAASILDRSLEILVLRKYFGGINIA